MRRFLLLLILAEFWGCVTGRPAPKPTKMVLVKGGMFVFGRATPCKADVDCENTKSFSSEFHAVYPEMRVKVKDFYIDEHEVTNEQYEYCVEKGVCPGRLYELGQTIGALRGEPYFQNPKYKDYPIVGVTYEEAEIYCRFVGKRLPTEFEWEYVAKGGKGGHLEFPNRYEQKSSDFYDRAMNNNCSGIRVPACDKAMIPNKVKENSSDVIDLGTGKVYDLTGNVSEWVDGIGILPQGSKVRYVTCDCGDSEKNPCLPPQCKWCPDDDTRGCLWCFDAQCKKDSECRSECYVDKEDEKCPDFIFRMCGESTKPTTPKFPICKPYPKDKVLTPEELRNRWKDFSDYKYNGVIRGCSYAGCKGWPDDKMVCGMYSANRTVLVSGKKTRELTLGFRCAKDAP